MWVNILTILIGLIGISYFWIRKKFSYFRSKGVAEDPGYFPLGSKTSWKMLTGRLAFTKITDDAYTNFPNEKVVGTYAAFGNPILIVRDLDIAKLVMIKDFDHFVDRRPLELSKKANRYFNDMLTVMTGERWKTMRNIISPVFTSGKLRSMMPIINEVSDEFIEYLKDFSDQGKEFDAKEMMTSYTLDVISNAGLGVKANSFSDPDSAIRKNVSTLIGGNQSFLGLMKLMTIFLFPKLAKLLDVSFIDPAATEFIVQVIKSSIALRREQKIRKNDIIDLLLDTLNEYQNSQTSEGENSKGSKNLFTQEEIEAALISNALLLVFGGFDTSSSGMSLVSYYLATNPEIQDRLFGEVEEAISQNDGDTHLDYNVIQSLPYLDQVVNESLRHYPLTIIERLCVKDYKIPGIDFVVPKGMLVQIASPMIMKSEKYFNNPEEFNPDNFSPENKAERGPYPFLAFGQGPRNCIGMRFALLIVKTAVARMVADYKLLPCSKTVENLDPDPRSRSLLPKGGIWIKVQKR